MKLSSTLCFILTWSAHLVMGQQPAVALENLIRAEDYRKAANPDSALIYYKKAALAYQQLDSIEPQVNAYNQMAIILTRQDQYEAARKYLDTALNIALPRLDSNNLTIATTYISLGVVYAAEELFGQSLVYHYKALAIRLHQLGDYHVDVATSYGNIGNVYFNSKRYDQAIEAHQKALDIRERIFGPSGVELIQSYTNLGNAWREKRNYATALDYFNRALRGKILQRGEGHKELAKYYLNLSEVYYRMDDKVQGDAYKAKAEAVAKATTSGN